MTDREADRWRSLYPVRELLGQGGVDPAGLCAACGLSDLDGVSVRPAPRWMRRLWSGPVAAMTLPWAIYIRPDVLLGDRQVLASLLVHEMVHVGQWRRYGLLGFGRRYVTGYLAGRRRGLGHYQAYLAIPLEAEARRIAGR